jgi:hypothetical protein
MFRKTYPELEELQARAMEVFPGEGASTRPSRAPSSRSPTAGTGRGGASVKMRFIEHERDYGRYHGHQYTRISFDEVTEYATPAGLLKMLSACAAPTACRARCGDGQPRRHRARVGQGALHRRRAGAHDPYLDPETGFTRMFVPSKMRDNVILMTTTRATQPPACGHRGQRGAAQGLVRGRLGHRRRGLLRELALGAARDPAVHAAQALDARPVDGLGQRTPVLDRLVVLAEDEWVKMGDGSERRFPTGRADPLSRVVRRRARPGRQSRPGRRAALDVEQIAKGIKEREAGEIINEHMSPAGTDMWKTEGGPSLRRAHAQDRQRHGPALQARRHQPSAGLAAGARRG